MSFLPASYFTDKSGAYAKRASVISLSDSSSSFVLGNNNNTDSVLIFKNHNCFNIGNNSNIGGLSDEDPIKKSIILGSNSLIQASESFTIGNNSKTYKVLNYNQYNSQTKTPTKHITDFDSIDGGDDNCLITKETLLNDHFFISIIFLIFMLRNHRFNPEANIVEYYNLI